jgi:hypothetical protein
MQMLSTAKVVPMGFEPTPMKATNLTLRLRLLGHSVFSFSGSTSINIINCELKFTLLVSYQGFSKEEQNASSYYLQSRNPMISVFFESLRVDIFRYECDKSNTVDKEDRYRTTPLKNTGSICKKSQTAITGYFKENNVVCMCMCMCIWGENLYIFIRFV